MVSESYLIDMTLEIDSRVSFTREFVFLKNPDK
jgi:hypothetical protein